jgi:hypothetical protein
MTATDRRFAGIKAVSTETVSTDVATGNTFHGTREEIAGRIRTLAKLGRTERWTAAIENWARMVETEASLEWSFLQGSIWASHAAD